MTSVENMLELYAQVRKVYIEEFNREFQDDNFSPNEMNIMIFLYNNPSIDTSSQLCVTLGVSKGLVSRSIDSLIKKGYITSYSDKKDKRIQHLQLTSQVEPVIKKIKKIKYNLNQDILDGISKEDIETMQRTLNLIKQRFIQRSIERGLKNETKDV